MLRMRVEGALGELLDEQHETIEEYESSKQAED
jgi:hypothetical protein